ALRFGLKGSYFQQSDFGGSGVGLTGLGSALSVGWSPTAKLQLAAAGLAASHHGTNMIPDSIQALGDVVLPGTSPAAVAERGWRSRRRSRAGDSRRSRRCTLGNISAT